MRCHPNERIGCCTLRPHPGFLKHSVKNLTFVMESKCVVSYCSEDNRVMLWDVRSAKGCMMVLDQHNGDTTAGPQSGNSPSRLPNSSAFCAEASGGKKSPSTQALQNGLGTFKDSRYRFASTEITLTQLVLFCMVLFCSENGAQRSCERVVFHGGRAALGHVRFRWQAALVEHHLREKHSRQLW